MLPKTIAALLMVVVSTPVWAGDPAVGQALYQDVALERTIKGQHYTDANCETCHQASFYQRSDRKVTSKALLETYVEGCNTNLDVGWFPDEVTDVAAWLNMEYYKFD